MPARLWAFIRVCLQDGRESPRCRNLRLQPSAEGSNWAGLLPTTPPLGEVALGRSGLNSENGVGQDFLEEEVRDLGRPGFYTLLMALGGLGSWGRVAHPSGHSHRKKSSKRQGDSADGGGRLRRQKRTFEQAEEWETQTGGTQTHRLHGELEDSDWAWSPGGVATPSPALGCGHAQIPPSPPRASRGRAEAPGGVGAPGLRP